MLSLKREFYYGLLAVFSLSIFGCQRCSQPSLEQVRNQPVTRRVDIFVYDRFQHMPVNIRKQFRMQYGSRTTTSVCAFLANNPHIRIMEYTCPQEEPDV